MADHLAPIRNALTKRAGGLARYLIGEPTGASKRELRWDSGLPSPRGGKWTTIDHQRLRSARKPGTRQPSTVTVGDTQHDR